MRKKSHISLARYIVANLEVEELSDHKKAFYLGSILPDCKPSFITTKHEINGTFDLVREEIMKLTTECDLYHRNARVYWRNLGQVIHYLADYFTFPHNSIYDGSLKDHCIYEKELKFALVEYIRSGEAKEDEGVSCQFKTPDALCNYILKVHEEYLQVKKTVQEDCRYIVSLCRIVVEGIIELLNLEIEKIFRPAIA